MQDLITGQTRVVEVPEPQVPKHGVLVKTACSLLSSGAERMLVDFGRASLVGKARLHPERVGELLDKISADGLLATWEATRSMLGESLPIGNCNVGKIIVVGPSVDRFRIGDRILSNGLHAEVVAVGFPARAGMGFQRNGSYAQVCTVMRRHL